MPKDRVAIIAHAFLWDDAKEPGRVNSALERLVRSLRVQYPDAPIFAQGELAALFDDLPSVVASPTLGDSPRYLGTRDIALWHQAECEKRGITRVVLVTAKTHYPRALGTTRKVGLKVVSADIPEVFSRRNPQRRWRYKPIAKFYEFLARMYYRVRGWM